MIKNYKFVLLLLQSFDLLKSQSSESDSEEEHDIDPSIHDGPAYTSLSSSHGNMNIKDQVVDNKVDDISVTAKGRFIVPTSTLLRIHSMDAVTVSPFSLDSTLDNPSGVTGLAYHVHLESTSFELFDNDDDDTQSTGICKEDSKEVMKPSQDDFSTSTLPSMPFKVSHFT